MVVSHSIGSVPVPLPSHFFNLFLVYLARHAHAELVVADGVVVGDGAALDDERGPRHG